MTGFIHCSKKGIRTKSEKFSLSGCRSCIKVLVKGRSRLGHTSHMQWIISLAICWNPALSWPVSLKLTRCSNMYYNNFGHRTFPLMEVTMEGGQKVLPTGSGARQLF